VELHKRPNFISLEFLNERRAWVPTPVQRCYGCKLLQLGERQNPADPKNTSWCAHRIFPMKSMQKQIIITLWKIRKKKKIHEKA
jgi:hypothetical protein